MTVPDSAQFDGPGAVFGLVLAWVRYHYWYAPVDSTAFETATAFLDGERCEHVQCPTCNAHCDSAAYEAMRYAGDQVEQWPCQCGHLLREHWLIEYDWKEYRDMMIGSLGMNVPGFVAAVKAGRP